MRLVSISKIGIVSISPMSDMNLNFRMTELHIFMSQENKGAEFPKLPEPVVTSTQIT